MHATGSDDATECDVCHAFADAAYDSAYVTGDHGNGSITINDNVGGTISGWDRGSGADSNRSVCSQCHAFADATRHYFDKTWTNANEVAGAPITAACGSCHNDGALPPTSGAHGTHLDAAESTATHNTIHGVSSPYIGSCADCHPHDGLTVPPNSGIHNDGTVNFAQRESATIGDPLLYGAKVVELAGRRVVLRLAAPLTEVERAVDGVQRAVALAGLLAMLFALVMAYLASRALSQPLVVLAHQARRLAGGDFEERAPRYMNIPELDDLSLAFNRLTDELQVRLGELGRERDEMQALIDCMAEGVVALTDDARVLRTNRAARALLDLPDAPAYAPIGTLVRHPELRAVLEESVTSPVSAREIEYGDLHFLVSSRLLDQGGAVTTFLDVTEVRRLERVRRDFVANASHELKTPLTSIRGFAETLLEGDPPDDLREQFLGSIRDNSLRLQRLVDDLLDLTRLESGRWDTEPEPMSMSTAAVEAWAPYADQAASRDISFECEGDVQVLADPQGLDQIFRNLLENALRHTGEGGSIRVSAGEGGACLVQIAVSDDGEGIPSRSLPRVFERFFRADSSRARDVGGTGLGLSIVRHLVSAMGGSAEAESELGRGTTIRFTLPRA